MLKADKSQIGVIWITRVPVDIKAGYRAVELMKEHVKSTMSGSLRADLRFLRHL